MSEGEEEKQEMENLFEKRMKENFPNLAKEIDFQEVQEAQRVPKKLDPRRNTPRWICNLNRKFINYPLCTRSCSSENLQTTLSILLPFPSVG